MTTLIKLDNKFTPFLFKAISAVKNSVFVTLGKYDVENFYVFFEDLVHERDGVKFYTISFYAKEVTEDNWMEVSSHEVGGINVDIDIRTKEVISIYSDR